MVVRTLIRMQRLGHWLGNSSHSSVCLAVAGLTEGPFVASKALCAHLVLILPSVVERVSMRVRPTWV